MELSAVSRNAALASRNCEGDGSVSATGMSFHSAMAVKIDTIAVVALTIAWTP